MTYNQKLWACRIGATVLFVAFALIPVWLDLAGLGRFN